MTIEHFKSDANVTQPHIIPSHWDIHKFKHVVKIVGGGTPSKENLDYWNGDIPWVSPKDMKLDLIESTEDYITKEGLLHSAAKMIPPNNILLVTRSGILKHTLPVAINGVEVVINQDLKAIFPYGGLTSTFLFWLLKGLSKEILFECKKIGATVDSVEIDNLLMMQVAIPSLKEQDLISQFLNRTTKQIDNLIIKKQKLIELLQEKRQAIIDEAVTKGLDPNMPMKNSGIEWLGNVPAHWKTMLLGIAAEKMTNGYVGPTRDILKEEGIRYFQSLHIKSGKIIFDRKPYYVDKDWSDKQAKSILKQGDVLFVQTGDIGQCAVVTKEEEGCNCHALIIVRLKRNIGIGDYLSWYFQSNHGKNTLLSYRTGALHPHLDTGRICDIKIAFPSIEEQCEINEYLNFETQKYDQIISLLQNQIEKLREYRQSLIREAVTGKIDVRQYGKEVMQ